MTVGVRRAVRWVGAARWVGRTVLGFLTVAISSGCWEWPGRVEPVDFIGSSGWHDYRNVYLDSAGYVIDPRRNGGMATSEGQGYALLRAAWLRDGETFDRVYEWTEAHLRRPDGLYAWLWAPADGGGTGRGDEGGRIVDANTATDADQEIALALILAAEAFGKERYRTRARELLEAIRAHASISLPDGWFPSAGNWAFEERIVNPSYFLPYAYPYFDRVDPDGDWMGVHARGYRLLEELLGRPGVRLPPDFMTVDPDGMPADLPPGSELSGDFSFDAMRVYWRVALDCVLHDADEACRDPLRTPEAAELLFREGTVHTRYAVDGQVLSDEESTSFYGGLLPALRLWAPSLAEQTLAEKLTPGTLEAVLGAPDRYYDSNWVWFGLAVETGLVQRRTPSPDALSVPP